MKNIITTILAADPKQLERDELILLIALQELCIAYVDGNLGEMVEVK